jgi:hypothetical protein
MRARAARRLASACALALAAAPAGARELWSEGERSVVLRTSLKGSLAPSKAPDDPELYPEPESLTSLWRLRFDLEARPDAAITAGVAYEHRLRVVSQGAGLAGSGILPPESPPFYRIQPLDWPIMEVPGGSWHHEIDRAFVAWHARGAEVTVGRQAVGLGRGVLFGAVDVFAPFSPLEADREWRRGVDAVRADVKLGDRWSLDGVAAFGESIDGSAFVARLRGYAGEVDGELVLGWRARDLMAGLVSSAAVGDAEVHGELAAYLTPDPYPGGLGAEERVVPKAVIGASYRIPVGQGVPVFLEWHWSGFGVADPADVVARLADPAFRERTLRGDTQILNQQVAALLASYEADPELTLSLLGLVSTRDASGVAAPGVALRLGDRVTVQASLYLSWGARPVGLELRSDYGAVPFSAFVQAAVYD